MFQVIDLLNPGAKRSNLTVRWDKRSRAFVVDNLFSIECGELDDLVAVLEVRSSRSYFIWMIKTNHYLVSELTLTASLKLLDLSKSH